MDHIEQPLGPPKNLGQMERFMETCLLFLLQESFDYGYALMERLFEFGFKEEEISIGALYNTLRRMEKAGLTESTWEESEHGPRRRVYTITKKGTEDLRQWMQILQTKVNEVQKLVNRYEQYTAKLAKE